MRDFFNNYRPRGTKSLPGADAISEDYALISSDIGPQLAAEQRLGKWNDLSFRDHVELLVAAIEILAQWRSQSRV
ncbi:MAG: hypothetical protein KGJ79_19000 [Alphaproteobacteria bacterium]|nr:hypothetical protein [Alphaproteobacteria bacterium]MDE2496037.1 hypothetical protein [Alphaproteobacteria bacterium]